MKTIAQLRWLALLAVFALLVAACSSSDDGSDDTSATAATSTTVAALDPIRVPAINQEDGVTAFPDEGQAVKSIFDWYNAQGGLDGHPLQLDLCTTGDDPESTQSCAQQIANDDSAAFVHSIMVPNSASLFDVMANAEKPILAQNQFDIPDALQPDVFASDPGLLPMATTLMLYTLEDLGLRNVGIVVSDDEVGRGTGEFLGFLVEEYGGTPAIISYDASVADLLPVFSAADLDAIDGIIFVPTSVEDCGPASQALKSLGFDKPILGGDACTAQTYVDAGKVDGWIFVVGTTRRIAGDAGRDQTIGIFNDYSGPPIGGLVAPASMGAYYVIGVLETAYASVDGDISAMTADVIRQAALDYKGPFTLGPEVFSCTGVDPFVGLCNTSATVVQLEGEEFTELTDWYVVDVAPYAALLEG